MKGFVGIVKTELETSEKTRFKDATLPLHFPSACHWETDYFAKSHRGNSLISLLSGPWERFYDTTMLHLTQFTHHTEAFQIKSAQPRLIKNDLLDPRPTRKTEKGNKDFLAASPGTTWKPLFECSREWCSAALAAAACLAVDSSSKDLALSSMEGVQAESQQ